jgi:CPA1 family monovalent cation:H+ antiporter
LAHLAQQRWPVAFLAVAGVLLSTALVGIGVHLALAVLGHPVPLIWCLVFGALISPTDPIAVLAIIRAAGAPKDLELKVAGESLCSDGVGIVVVLELLAPATGERTGGRVPARPSR